MSFVQLAAIVYGFASLGYIVVAAAYQFQGRPGMMVALSAYVVSNVGIIYDLLTWKG